VIISFATDIGPCISVLEVKFIDLFKNLRPSKNKERLMTFDTD